MLTGALEGLSVCSPATSFSVDHVVGFPLGCPGGWYQRDLYAPTRRACPRFTLANRGDRSLLSRCPYGPDRKFQFPRALGLEFLFIFLFCISKHYPCLVSVKQNRNYKDRKYTDNNSGYSKVTGIKMKFCIFSLGHDVLKRMAEASRVPVAVEFNWATVMLMHFRTQLLPPRLPLGAKKLI